MSKPQGERQRVWRKANPGRVRDYNREHYAKYRAHYKQKPSKYHGLTLDQVLERLREQGGRCALCRTDKSGGKGWHGDHDHLTKKFRAVLCTKCNMGLGLFSDDAARMRAAADYLERHAQLHSLL